MEDAGYQKGLEILGKINKDSATRIQELLKDIAPDMAHLIIEFAYGNIYSRKGLDLKTRELITIASLTTLGKTKGPLKAHIKNALDLGASKEEIIEVIMQMSIYAGFPVALDALLTANEVFA